MEQRIIVLEQGFTQLTQTIAKIITRIQGHTSEIEELRSALAALQQGVAAVASTNTTTNEPRQRRASSGKRRPRNQGDWQKVQDALNSGKTAWKEIAEITGIPESTCRTYGKIKEEEARKLPFIDDEPVPEGVVAVGTDADGVTEYVMAGSADALAVQQQQQQQQQQVQQQPVQQPVQQQVAAPTSSAAPAPGVTEADLNATLTAILGDSQSLINKEF